MSRFVKLRNLFLFSVLCPLFSVLIDANALDIPPRPRSRVNDYASILSSKTKSTLEDTLADFESKTTNQIVVATFVSLEGQNLEDFSIRLAQKWKVGSKGKDNGIIAVIFKDDRQIRIEVGYGLEGILPDALCDAIIRKEITPYFRKGDYDNGVLNGVDAIIKALAGEYKSAGPSQDTLDGVPAVFVIMVFFLIIGLSSYAAYRRQRNGYWGASSRGDYYGGWGSHYGGGFGGGGFGGGGGGFGGGGASGRW